MDRIALSQAILIILNYCRLIKYVQYMFNKEMHISVPYLAKVVEKKLFLTHAECVVLRRSGQK